MSAREILVRSVGTVAVAVATGFGGEAVAASYAVGPDHYLSAGFVYSEPDNGRTADYGTGGSLAYAQRLGQTRWLELKFFNSILETGATTAVDFYQTGLGLDVLQPLGDEGPQHFFLLLGGGLVLNDVKPDTKDDSGAYVNTGIGWRINASENWGVRPRIELRYFYDTFDSGQGDVQLGLAFEIPPRTERVVERMVEVEKIVEVPVEVEKIVEVEVGCAPGAVPTGTPAAAPAVDSDGDGVPDDQDRCPSTSAGAAVGPNGCVLLK